jgi:hypothetical protein
MLQSKGVVRRIVKDHDRFLVSFPKHDGYFHLDDEILREKIRKGIVKAGKFSSPLTPP